MKKLVCGNFGTIYYATVLKDGLMSDKKRVDVTDDAIIAVVNHLMLQKEWDRGFTGYEFSKKDNSGKITLCLYDNDKYTLRKRDVETEK